MCKHTIITVGDLGGKVAYLDLTRDEVISKVAASLNTSRERVEAAIEEGRLPINEFSFEDAFYAYETGPLEDSGFPIKSGDLG
jgi:hypothetical protein